jgi:hypothetical protein
LVAVEEEMMTMMKEAENEVERPVTILISMPKN